MHREADRFGLRTATTHHARGWTGIAAAAGGRGSPSGRRALRSAHGHARRAEQHDGSARGDYAPCSGLNSNRRRPSARRQQRWRRGFAQVSEDAINRGRCRDKGDQAHLTAAAQADQRQHLVDARQQPYPQRRGLATGRWARRYVELCQLGGGLGRFLDRLRTAPAVLAACRAYRWACTDWRRDSHSSSPAALEAMNNFRSINRDTGFPPTPSVDKWLPQRHPARLVAKVIDGLDLSELLKAYRGSGSASQSPGDAAGAAGARAWTHTQCRLWSVQPETSVRQAARNCDEQ